MSFCNVCTGHVITCVLVSVLVTASMLLPFPHMLGNKWQRRGETQAFPDALKGCWAIFCCSPECGVQLATGHTEGNCLLCKEAAKRSGMQECTERHQYVRRHIQLVKPGLNDKTQGDGESRPLDGQTQAHCNSLHTWRFCTHLICLLIITYHTNSFFY